MDSKVKVIDLTNGWESEVMSPESAGAILSESAPTARIITDYLDAEWQYDHRFGEWAWFTARKRIT